jgi:hypothetical protein
MSKLAAALRDAMAELRRLFRRLLPHLLETLLRATFFCFAWYIIFENHRRQTPEIVVDAVFVVFVLAAVYLGFVLPQRENRLLGDLRKQPFRLEADEALLFNCRWVGCLLFLRAEDCNPRA